MSDVPPTEERKISLWLYLSYIGIILWGLWAFYAYWNGSSGWLDRGYWRKLQEAAHTTYPFQEPDVPLEGRAKNTSLGTKGV